jgi:cadmium resistance protein CadD (predicted permease)
MLTECHTAIDTQANMLLHFSKIKHHQDAAKILMAQFSGSSLI